ncbi:cyclin-dependent kinase regulatory subunit CKS1 [Cystobasidium minutum MCA 4210]|uniref:cyclin-dependent kinase regulatory subunit CKS1 n=1 Tax=Cystobasidium minutum MCA 4210 TaxID=1397322 RepID=UPI0034CF022B|eukprot:jgi/Rhomi1/174826/fgenesh1_kg.8_\
MTLKDTLDSEWDAMSQRERDIEKYADSVFYSARYSDDTHEYRHVILPKQLAQYLPKGVTATEEEWRSLGIRQSPGWVHYAIHKPEPHIMLFRRPLELGLKYPAQQAHDAASETVKV